MDKYSRFLIALLSICTPSLFHANEIISTPGLYIAGADIIDTSTGTTGPLITIATSNVIFDLSENFLYQDPVPSGTTSIGIRIEPGLSNIVIQNGSIGPIGGIGILIGEGCSNILVRDVALSACSRAGIVSEGSPGNPINGVTISSSSLTSCTGNTSERIAGFDAAYTNAFIARESYFSHNTNSAGPAYGIYCNNCISGELINCRNNNNTGLCHGAGTYLVTCTNIRIIECACTQNMTTSTTGDCAAYGIYLENCTSVACESSLTGAELCLSGSAYGIYAENSIGIGVKNTICAEHIGGYLASCISFINGTHLILVENTLEGCTALTGTAYGIEIRNGSLSSVRNNTILNNSGASAFGILDDGEPSDNVYISNYAFHNGINYSITYTGGVTLPVVEGSLAGPPGLPTNTGGILDNISINI